jgi:cell division protein FtsI/penicillin-binding protein 2
MAKPRAARKLTRLDKAPASLLVLGLLGALPTARGATEDRLRAEAIRLGDGRAEATLADGSVAVLDLDAPLQRSATRLLAAARPKIGAIVAIDVTSGRVLAWTGSASGAPSARAVTETLAPAASLFKIVTTTALLEKHVDPSRTVCVEGGSSAISAENLAVPRFGHALCAPFREALGRSRNAVFAQLATRFLHPDDLIETAERLGFGRDAPIEVEAPIGTFDAPDDALGFARSAAGFVGSTLSPLGAAYLATTVASAGRLLGLHLLADPEARHSHRDVVGRAMHDATAREIRRMMELTIHSGTSRDAFTDPEGHSYLGDVRAAGKTGTLQPDARGPMTSWFVGFAPSRAPRVAISVLLENGYGWRRKANEVGRDVLRAYFAARGYRGVTAP